MTRGRDPGDDGRVQVRRARPSDRDAIYDVCLRTGDAGGDASGLVADHDLLGDIWAGPYLALRPQLAFVAETSGGVEGYLVGTEESAAFARECEAQWWPAIRARYPDPPDDRELTPDEALHRRIHHPSGPPHSVMDHYPAHLHLNLLPPLQGRGVGRRMLETLFDALVDVPGIHVGVAPRNARAASFYVHNGFVPVGGHRAPGQGWLLGRRLAR